VSRAIRRQESFGQYGLSLVDRLGTYLSRRAILRHLPRRRDLTILDIGCGYHATFLRALTPYLAEGVGIDVSIAGELKELPKLTLIESEIGNALPNLENARFDVILLISVLEHLWEPGCILRECHRILKPGGVLLINVPTWRGKSYLEFSAFRLGLSARTEIEDHKMYYDRRDLWPFMVESGFKPSGIRLRYHKFGLNLFAVAKK